MGHLFQAGRVKAESVQPVHVVDLQVAAVLLQLLDALDEVRGLVVEVDGGLILPVFDDVGGDAVVGVGGVVRDAAGFLTAASDEAGNGLLQGFHLARFGLQGDEEMNGFGHGGS